MAKHSILIAVIAALLLATVIAASIYETTTATTVEINDENPAADQDQCRQQIQGQQQLLNVCLRYLVDSSRSPQATNIKTSWREAFPRCCQQLEKVQEQCRCTAVKMVVEQLQGGGPGGEELQGQERQEMLETAMTLPALCRMEPQQRCDIQSAAAAAAWF